MDLSTVFARLLSAQPPLALNPATEVPLAVAAVLATIAAPPGDVPTPVDPAQLQADLAVLAAAGERLATMATPTPALSDDATALGRRLAAFARAVETAATASASWALLDVEALAPRSRGQGRRAELRRAVLTVLLVEMFKRTRGGPSFARVGEVLVAFGVAEPSVHLARSVWQSYRRSVAGRHRLAQAPGVIYDRFAAAAAARGQGNLPVAPRVPAVPPTRSARRHRRTTP